MLQKLTYSIEEVVIETGICRTAVYAEMNAGNLKAIKIGRRTFIRNEDLRAFLDNAPKRTAKSAA